ncbi:hypothetical protein EC991_010358, partial [Linnemannia zychae]
MGPWPKIYKAALKYSGGAGSYLKLGEQSTAEGYSYTGENKICARVKNEKFTLPSDYYESYMLAGRRWCEAEMGSKWSDTYGPNNCDCHSAGFLFHGECGTRQYRAPEMYDKNYYSYPADVFAFGVTVHRMAGGQLPEQGGIFPLSSADVKEVVTVLMHHFAEMRLRMDEASDHPFFQGSTLDGPKSETKRPLVDDDDGTAIEDDHKDKRIRHDSNADNKDALEENMQ